MDELDTAPLTAEQFNTLKLYLKVDQNIEDDLLMQMVHDAADEIATAVKTGSTPEDYLQSETKRSRFFSAIMKVVKENYDYRGEGAEIMRYPLLEPVNSTINQLRGEADEDE